LTLFSNWSCVKRTRRRFTVSTLALALLSVAIGQGQGPLSGRTVTQPIAPGGVDRGLLAGEASAPRRVERDLRHVGQRTVPADRPGASGTPYVPGRVIVKFRDGAAADARLSALSSVSRTAALTTRKPYANFDIIELDPAEDPEIAARVLAARPDVEYAQAVYRLHPYFIPNDPLYAQYQWNLRSIDMERAWDIQPGATASIVVAVLDTGIAFRSQIITFNAQAFRVFFPDGTFLQYPALGQINVPFAAAPELAGPTRFVAPRDFIWDDDDPVDMDGHGTHVSGTIGQLTNNGIGVAGVAFNVRLMPVKVINGDWDLIFGAPFEGTDDTAARGTRYAADNGARVINMSIGRSGPPSPVMEDAMRYAVSRGAFIAVAAGNSFEDGNPVEIFAEIASRIEGALSVAALDPQHNRAFYSTTGPYVEIAAPGGSSRGFGAAGTIYQQTYDPAFVETYELPPSSYRPPRFDIFVYAPFQGTSMATPHVSGLAALLMQQGITNPAAIEAALERFASDRGSPGRDNETGAGEINARNTLRGLGLTR
jgi:serine protease